MSSVRVLYTDPNDIEKEVLSFVSKIKSERPKITAVYWFGSWVNGDYTPYSDVDLCIVLSDSPLPRRERIPLYLPEKFPAGLDLHIYTEAELEALRTEHPSWYKVITGGRRL